MTDLQDSVKLEWGGIAQWVERLAHGQQNNVGFES